MIQFSWTHGLGDTASAAQMLTLWTKRGHRIAVKCSPDKECLFKVAGCEIAHTGQHHPWSHAPAPGAPGLLDGWSGNKIAWNLTQPPLPPIGTWEELWPELCDSLLMMTGAVSEKVKNKISGLIDGLQRPLVLFHPKGNTAPKAKNFTNELERDTAIAIMEKTGGTVIILDWDNRCANVKSYKFRNSGNDWGPLTVEELYWLLCQSQLFVGVDSGPLHLCRMTRCPSVGVWFGHHPCHYAIPSTDGVHLVSPGNPWAHWNRFRRHEYNIVETELTAENIGRWSAERMLSANGVDVAVSALLERCRCVVPYVDRHLSFKKFFERLPALPRVVETGSIRSEEDWGAGFFSYICGLHLSGKGGELHTLEIDEAKAQFARRWTEPLPVTVHTTDSLRWLNEDSGVIDGLYLDSLDVYEEGHQQHCLNEFLAARGRLTPHAPILIDDTYYDGRRWVGKGELVVPRMLDDGFKIAYSGWQTLLVNGRECGRDIRDPLQD